MFSIFVTFSDAICICSPTSEDISDIYLAIDTYELDLPTAQCQRYWV